MILRENVQRSDRSAAAAVGPRTERVLAALARFARGRGVTVKTRHALTTFGEGLEDDEVRYLYTVVPQGSTGDCRWRTAVSFAICGAAAIAESGSCRKR